VLLLSFVSPISPLPSPRVSVERLSRAFHPGFASAALGAALLRVRVSRASGAKLCRSAGKPPESEGRSPAGGLFWVCVHAVCAAAENGGARKI